VGDVGRAGGPFDDAVVRQPGGGDGAPVRLPPEAFVKNAVLVGEGGVFAVHDQSQCDSAVGGGLEGLRGRQVPELVETTQQRVPGCAGIDEREDRWCEVTREPRQPLLFLGGIEVADRGGIEAPHVGLAAGGAPVEEHLVGVGGVQRLGAHRDRQAGAAAVEVVRGAFERVEHVGVVGCQKSGLGR
jgi:hypothetical protein